MWGMREPDLAISRAASYRRLRPLATGGMGRVDLAVRREGTFFRLCAIKRLHEHLREDAEVRAMFLDEARIAGLIRHPNVVSVVDLGEDEEGPFLVMDYVDGVPVGEIIKRAVDCAESIPLEVALRIGHHAALGLHAAHDLMAPDGTPLSLVHRDISPHNILVGFDGIARVTDFGIAKALGRLSRTSTGILKGKLGYMSPEQLKFRPPDRRSDLFSLGVVLFELFTSRRLYPGKLGEESALRILEEPAPDLLEFRDDAPPELVGLMFKLLAKSPDQRPADARSVANSLETILLDLVAAGERTDTSEYLERLFGEERQKFEREVAQALAALESEPEEASPPSSKRQKRTPPLSRRGLAVALGVALLGVAAIGWLRAEGETPAPELMATTSGLLTSWMPRGQEARAAGEDESRDDAEATAGEGEREKTAQRGRASRVKSQRSPRTRGRESKEEPVRLWNWK
jgi:eukaryotic-like serine/threonine-protein kinase